MEPSPPGVMFKSQSRKAIHYNQHEKCFYCKNIKQNSSVWRYDVLPVRLLGLWAPVWGPGIPDDKNVKNLTCIFENESDLSRNVVYLLLMTILSKNISHNAFQIVFIIKEDRKT